MLQGTFDTVFNVMLPYLNPVFYTGLQNLAISWSDLLQRSSRTQMGFKKDIDKSRGILVLQRWDFEAF